MSGHYGTTPSDVCDAVVAALQVFQRGPGNPTGACLTVTRIDDDTIEAIDRFLAAGLPALLVYDAGGKADVQGTNKLKFVETMTIRVIAAAGQHRAALDRVDGTEAVPGCEQLCNWAVYFGVRAIRALQGIHGARPVKRDPTVRLSPEKLLASWHIEARRQIDLYDDELPGALAELGLVANPLDPDRLWLDDGEGEPQVEPNIADPATAQGGAADL